MKMYQYILPLIAALFASQAFASNVADSCKLNEIVIKNNTHTALYYAGDKLSPNWTLTPLNTRIAPGSTGRIIINNKNPMARESLQGALLFLDSNFKYHILKIIIPIEMKFSRPYFAMANFRVTQTGWKENPTIKPVCLDTIQENITISAPNAVDN